MCNVPSTNEPNPLGAPATRMAPRLPLALGGGARTWVHGARWPRVALLTHQPTGTAPRPRSSRQESMAILAPRSHLLLGLTRPQQPTALRACAAFSRSRGAPVPPRAAQPRRVFLGLGATFVDQVTRMASGGTSSRSFVAGARPREGVSPVEQVFRRCLFSKISLQSCTVFCFRTWLMEIYCRFWRMWSGPMSSLSSLRTSAASTSK